MFNPNVPVMELPRYKCHKEVWALKIKKMDFTASGVLVTPEEGRYAPFPVSDAYVMKHKPEVGGYYVRYKDGYESYSPAQAFEEGYTRLESNA